MLPEFAVGDGLQPELLLHLDDVADGIFLDFGELCGVDLAGGVLLSRPQQFGRAQEAADMLGAKRWIHRWSLMACMTATIMHWRAACIPRWQLAQRSTPASRNAAAKASRSATPRSETAQ